MLSKGKENIGTGRVWGFVTWHHFCPQAIKHQFMKKNWGKISVMSMKFQWSSSSRRNFLPKKRQTQSRSLVLWLGLRTCAGSRSIVFGFLFSGEHPHHHTTATLLISDLLHWGFGLFIPTAREKMTRTFSGWAHLSYVAMEPHSSAI